MTEVQVNRWRHWGHDRLYVDTADGIPIGWFDPVSGTYGIDQPDLVSALASAVAEHFPTAPPPPAPISPDVAVPSGSDIKTGAEAMWADLSLNKPGQEARKQATSWATGADGEEVVGEHLEALGAFGWRVLHAIPVGCQDADIDHVAIGPGGVFTLNTKTHLGHEVRAYEHTIYVAGQKQTRYYRNSRHEAARAARLLTSACGFPVPVSAVIVVLCGSLTINQERTGVQVVKGSNIATWLIDHPAALPAVEVDAIWEQARRSTTWR